MFRRSSMPKWKQVLGFDDAVPTYNPPPSPPLSLVSSYEEEPITDLSLSLAAISTSGFPRLPRDVTFTRTGLHDIFLSPTSPAPSPNDFKPLPDPPALLYITCQQEIISDETKYTLPKPDLILHSGPTKTKSIISFASFQDISAVADITLCPLQPTRSIFPNTPSINRARSESIPAPNYSFPKPHRYGRSVGSTPIFKTEKLTVPIGGLFATEKYSFSITLPRTSVREKFEWRHSSGPFVRTPDGIRETGGLKLVRSITGETVAVYAGMGSKSRAKNPRRVVGMFRFLGDRLGEEFDVFAIMSILSIVERGRRIVDANRVAFGIN